MTVTTLRNLPRIDATPDGPLRLSVLDLIPVRSGQSSGNALRASVRLAQVAERSGMHRYWVAEHHNMPAVAATNPPVLIALLARLTARSWPPRIPLSSSRCAPGGSWAHRTLPSREITHLAQTYGVDEVMITRGWLVAG